MLDLAKLSAELDGRATFILRPHPHEILRATADPDVVKNADEHFMNWAKQINFRNFRIERRQPASVAIAAADVVLTFGESTIIPEAMILQRPVIIAPFFKGANRTYNETIGIQVANNYFELAAAVSSLLPSDDAHSKAVAQQNKILRELNFGHDGKARERIADLIISLAGKKQAAAGESSNKSRLRILQIVHDFPPQSFSGTELYTLNFSQELRKLGHDVTALYPVYDSARKSLQFEAAVYEGLKVVRFNVFQPGKKNSDILNNEFDAPFRLFLKRNDFDIVHIQHLFGLSANWVTIAKACGLPVLMKIDDMYLYCRQGHLMYKSRSYCSGPESLDKCYGCTFRNRSSDPEYVAGIYYYLALRREVLQRMFQQADFIHSPSLFLKETSIANNFNNPEFHVIPTGISPFEVVERRKEKGVIRIGFMGEIDIRKGIAVFLDAIEMANQKMAAGERQDLHFKIYGKHFNNDLYRSMCARVNGFANVTYFGGFTPDQRAEIFSEIDLLAMPSLGENYPFILREALYAGLPAVATAIAGVPEIIVDGENGFLIPPGDAAALADIFIRVAGSSSFFEKLKPQKNEMKLIAQDAAEFEEIYFGLARNNSVAGDEPALQKIRDLISAKKFIDGLNLLSGIIEKNPRNPAALELMSEIYARLGKTGEAVKLQNLAKQFSK
jgi:glycosyltransferase involved in cell wall biosynthesis